MAYTLSDLAKAADAEIIGDQTISGNFRLLTDSRTLTDPENSVFIALKTPYNDGHLYIRELIKKGVRIFLVHKDRVESFEPGVHYLIVKNSLQALQQIVSFHRNHFKIPVVGITGSNGKTIVKEWLLQLLGKDLSICANPKSYNSQIGVPLSVWQLNKTHELALFEAGISRPGEMEKLENIIAPEWGILTHLGPAHNEGFENPEQKLDEKLKLFKRCKTVFTAYQPLLKEKMLPELKTFGFQEPKSDFNIVEVQREKNRTQIRGKYKEEFVVFGIPFTDEASIENACLCCLFVLSLDKFNAAAFENLTPVSMRMELKKGIHRCLLINDSYSNDLNALSNALSFLKQQSVHPKTTVILSDIEESGLPIDILYLQVKNLLLEKNVKRLIGVGKDYLAVKEQFLPHFETYFYPGTNDLLLDLNRIGFHEESILVKGARKFEFEKVVRKLEQESHVSVLEINMSATLKNLDAIKNHLPQDMKIMAMVKAFAYGSGSYEIAKLLQHKVNYLAVAYADEGVALRKNGIQTPIMVMNTGESSFGHLTAYDLEPVVFSLEQFEDFHSAQSNAGGKIHIELDTGMHRLGFTADDTDKLIYALKNSEQLKVASVFSHLSGSDDAQFDAFSKQQIETFRDLAQRIEKALGYKILKHISNTAAALRFGQEGMDMVRLGIGLYGIDPTGRYGNMLEPVFTLKTYISQIKNVAAFESIGYSRKSISEKPRTIAVLALGYADGLNRALGNGKGGFYVHGKYAPLCGNVCMDMCMVDVSDIECDTGDEAILFGKEYPIAEIAHKLQTIPYEVLTSISQRVKRIYVSE